MIRCFLFLLLLSAQAYAQKPPSQAEINKMKKQMEAQLKQLEKEDPETAKLVKQMMGQASGKKASAKKQENAIEKIPVKAPVKPPTEKEATAILFGFRGKKLDQNTIITTSGTLIQYQPTKNRLVVQPDPKKDPFGPMVSELQQSGRRRNEFIEKMDHARNRYFIYPFVKQALDGFDEAEETVAGSMTNVIELPSAPASLYAEKKQAGGKPSGAPASVVADHDAVIEYLKAHKNDTDFFIPPPPERSNDLCLACDKERSKKEDAADSMYIDAFIDEEKTMVGKALAVMAAWQKGGQPKAWESLSDDMFDAIPLLFEHLSKKVDALYARYKENFKSTTVITQILISVERQKELMGILNEGSDVLPRIAHMLNNSNQYVRKQMREKNYKEALNFQWIFGMERLKQLLGISGGDSLVVLMDDLQKFNRFKVTIDANVKVVTGRDENGQIKDWVMAHLKGSEYFSFFPDSNCRLRMINNRRSDLRDDEITEKETYELVQFHLQLVDVKSTEATYLGPGEWITAQPGLTGGFCDPSDTLLLYAFGTYTPFEGVMATKPNVERWNFPEAGTQELQIISGALSTAFHPHDITNPVSEPNVESVVSAITAGFDENQTLNDMKMRSNIMQLEAGAFTAGHTGGLYLEGHLRNRSDVVFESEIDGRQDNPDVDDVLVANLKVKIEHAPLKN